MVDIYRDSSLDGGCSSIESYLLLFLVVLWKLRIEPFILVYLGLICLGISRLCFDSLKASFLLDYPISSTIPPILGSRMVLFVLS